MCVYIYIYCYLSVFIRRPGKCMNSSLNTVSVWIRLCGVDYSSIFYVLRSSIISLFWSRHDYQVLWKKRFLKSFIARLKIRIEIFSGEKKKRKKGTNFVGCISHLSRTRQNSESNDTFEKSSSILSVKRNTRQCIAHCWSIIESNETRGDSWSKCSKCGRWRMEIVRRSLKDRENYHGHVIDSHV